MSTSNEDAYLNRISPDSLEVLKAFGDEAPALLNEYACGLQDQVTEQLEAIQLLVTIVASNKLEIPAALQEQLIAIGEKARDAVVPQRVDE